MKVIGITEIQHSQYSKEKGYVVIVAESELRKVADKASYRDDDRFPPLQVGQEYDLAAGFNFRAALAQSIQSMTEAYERFAKVAPLAAQFAGIVVDKQQAAKPDA